MSLASVATAAVPERTTRVTSQGALRQMRAPRQQMTAAPAQIPVTREAPANAVEVPFTHDLGKGGTEVKNYTDINVNNDNRKWQYGKVSGYAACMVPNADNVDANDDWLITVPIHLPAGNYVLSFEIGMMGSGAISVSLDASIGKTPTVEGMATQVVAPLTHTQTGFQKYEYGVSIDEEGYYYVGFHCTTTKAQKGTLKLANVGMKAGTVAPPADPPAAGQLSWTLAPRGELKATVTYVAPTKTVSGADLTEISKVLITSRWDVDKFEYTDVQPGQTITREVEMYAGINNRFTAVAYVGDTPGEKVEYKNIWCGPDAPKAPENVKLTPSADYTKASLTWNAVTEGEHEGGYVDPAEVTYYIFDAFGSYYDPAIAEVKGSTSYTFDYSDLEAQDFVAYQVTAGYGEYYSLDTSSNIVVVGKPDQAPFTESFTDGSYDKVWVLDPQTSYSGQDYGTVDDSYFESLLDPDDPESPKPLKSQDGDNGFFFWMPIETDVMWGLQSVRVDLSKTKNPVLDVWYQGKGSTLDIMAAHGEAEFAPLRTIALKDAPTDDWTLCRVPLDEFKTDGTVRVALRLTATDNTDTEMWSVPLDHISIHDLVEKDLALRGLNVAESVKAGEKLPVTARVENVGTAHAAEATLEWSINGEKIAENSLSAISANEIRMVSAELPIALNATDIIEVVARIVAEGDAVEHNNSHTASVSVKFNEFPTVTDLAANINKETVTLTWSAPALDNLPGPKTVTEDFENEDYTPMSISGAGDWTVYDGDKQKTYNIFREQYNPFQTQPMAFQLFNTKLAQIPEQYQPDAETHSGDSFMMAPSAQTKNDNWLISPELSGSAQTISFWAKSMMSAWPESFELLYSVTGNTRDCFTQTVEVQNYPASGEVPEVWTEFKAALPEGAKYFAIHHDSDDTLALLIDDVTYEAAPEMPLDLAVTGYHVFRNGKQITEATVAETSYSDTPAATYNETGSHTFRYSVVAVYNHGAARVSNEVEVALTSSGIEVVGIEELHKAKVYNLQGIRVANRDIVPGVYIVVDASGSRKALVK